MWSICVHRKEKFFHHYQPIVSLQTAEVEGYEALFRSRVFHNPEKAFRRAIRKNQLFEFDIHSLRKALRTFALDGPANKGKKLFLNVYPSTILHRDFVPFILQMIDHCSFPAHQIVLEIVEHESIVDFTALLTAINFLKKMGILIAVDDFGKGADTINRTIEIDADYIKLDRYFSVGLTQSRKKQAYVEFLVRYCTKFNAKLIFEGLETECDIACAQMLGVSFAQGFAIGRPQSISKSM
ncbi:EAL domain-containing protein [Sporolactobacillus sp. STCC-11]|uniref:EAL domain-containing protein n=1 Tax=Sporolactobacillus caesalpiniae TaxID=3230362 RepID=UPI0033913552